MTIAPLQRVLTWSLDYKGSSRSSALIRFGLVFLIWARWGEEMVLFRDLTLSGFLLSASFFVSTALMLIGFLTRLSTAGVAALLFSMYYYFGHHLGQEPWTHHHTYLLAMVTFLSALTPAGRCYSLDRWLAVRRAQRKGQAPPPEKGNLFGLRLMMLQLCVLYFFAALDKSYLLWTSGVRLEYYAMFFYLGPSYPAWDGFNPLMSGLAWTVLALEYVLAFGLFVRRLLVWLVPAGIGMHVAFYILLPVYTYSLTCILMYLAIFDADKIHELTET